MSYVAAAKYMGKSKSFVAKWVQQYKKTKNVDDLPERGSMPWQSDAEHGKKKL